MTEALIAILALVAGFLVGYVVRLQMSNARASSAEAKAEKRLAEAELEAEQLLRKSTTEGRDQIEQARRRSEQEFEARREELTRREQGLDQRDQTLEQRDQTLDTKAQGIDRRSAEAEELKADLRDKAEEAERRLVDLDEERQLLDAAASVQRRELERVAQMTAHEAKDALVGQVVEEAKRQAMATVREIEERAREEGEERARKIVTVAIQRVASEQTAESTVSVYPLPSEDMKGRIIGREGRNIRAFEATTGVNLIIDDTPEAVVLSCFDPVRREVARLTLDKLVGDGRIQPARIEEMYERSLREIEDEVKRAGEAAILEVNIPDVHPEMIKVLGRLQYRTSYGQNVLRHLIESAHIAVGLASELGLDPTIPKRGAFLHDIGKALTHEVEGSHAIIGAELARRLGESPEVCHAIEAHHGEVEARTMEAVLAQVADQISGGRPGARRESLETYVKRLERLEEICTTHPGVAKTFAMQAGREVRVVVEPEEVDDVAAQVLARDIAKQVEEELQYPGQIRITVVREMRAVEYAK